MSDLIIETIEERGAPPDPIDVYEECFNNGLRIAWEEFLNAFEIMEKCGFQIVRKEES